MDYLKPSTMELKNGKWVSFLTWHKVVDKDITGVDLIPLKEDVSKRIRTYIEEHSLSYPGVEVANEYLRDYPQGDMAAQVLGHVGPISADELESKHFKGYAGGDIVGQDGLEWTYDEWLRGRDGVAKVEVDAQGHPKAGALGARRPHGAGGRHAGHDHRQQGAGGRRTGAARRHRGGARRRPVCRERRRGRRARRPEGRRAGDGELPDLRPQPVGRRHQHQGLQDAHQQARQQPACSCAPSWRPRRWARPSSRSPRWPRSRKASSRRRRRSGAPATTPHRTTTPSRRTSSSAGPPADTAPSTSSARSRSPATSTSTTSATSSIESKGTALEDWATRFGMGKPTGIDVPGESRGQGADAGRGRRSTSRRRSTSSGSPATRSSSPSARATWRRRRCNSPPPTPRSPTAARS